jgi:3,4-dihydroxy-2-butanone 4-phosphate synthase
MRLDDLKVMAVKHNLVVTSVQDIIAYRLEMEDSSK